MTQTEIAKLMGVSQPSVNAWCRRGCPTESAEAVRAWCEANLVHRRRKHVRQVQPGAAAPSSLVGSVTGQLTQARLDRERAEARMAELKLAELAGELVRADAVAATWARALVALRGALRNLPARWGQIFSAETDAAVITRTLQSEIDQALTDASEARK